MHDTGGGQRSAQIALELLARGWAVLFVSHDRVTETVDLRLSFKHPRLLECGLEVALRESGHETLRAFLRHPDAIVITQIPVRSWLPILSLARTTGAVRVYDLIDEWDSELGYGWYRRGAERRVLARSDVVVATAPSLQRHLAARSSRPVAMLPNAFNHRIFSPHREYGRPTDLPDDPVALYVGSLWGSWMDWDLLQAAALALPSVSFVFIGDHRTEGAGLPANCRFLGLKAQSDLPAYLRHASVALLPWKNDRVTQATSPLKVFEYVAMGLRVVAPALEPLSGIPGVIPCTGAPAFEEALRDAVTTAPTAAEREGMTAFAAAHSWDRRVDALLSLVAQARRTRGTPSLRERLRELTGW